MQPLMEQHPRVKQPAPRRPLNPQLQWIADLLTEHEVPYWLDSGTLLGVVRDGDVMHHDKDIDLAIWSEDLGKVQGLFPKFEKAGYQVKTGVFEKIVYNVLLEPKNGEGITISIGVHRLEGDKVWRMATFVTDNPHPRWGLRFFIRGAWRFPIRQVARCATLLKIPRARLVDLWPFSTVFGTGVWILPRKYVEEIVPHETTGLPIPARTNAYLTTRYGDWRQPVRDWSWYRDDAAAHIGHPIELVERATR